VKVTWFRVESQVNSVPIVTDDIFGSRILTVTSPHKLLESVMLMGGEGRRKLGSKNKREERSPRRIPSDSSLCQQITVIKSWWEKIFITHTWKDQSYFKGEMRMREAQWTSRACEEDVNKVIKQSERVKVAVNEAPCLDGYGSSKIDLPLHLMVLS